MVYHCQWHQGDWERIPVCPSCGEKVTYQTYHWWCWSHGEVRELAFKIPERPPCPWCGVRNQRTYGE